MMSGEYLAHRLEPNYPRLSLPREAEPPTSIKVFGKASLSTHRAAKPHLARRELGAMLPCTFISADREVEWEVGFIKRFAGDEAFGTLIVKGKFIGSYKY